jgi:hypothetical protein
METARQNHAAAYFEGWLYVVGGVSHSVATSSCERYSVTLNSWEAVAPLPSPCFDLSVLVNGTPPCLYTFGGTVNKIMHNALIQVLSLHTLTWRTLKLKLPFKSAKIPCFKAHEDSQKVYFVHRRSLYSLDLARQTIVYVKKLINAVEAANGPSYYSRGHLYCNDLEMTLVKVEVGDLGE